MHVKIDYTWLGKVENELRSSIYDIKDIHYLENVEIEVYVEEGQTQKFVEWMTEMTNGQSEIFEGDLTYLEKEISQKEEN
jgi:putative IMPACT (imprinted ancient) family translation regulator